MLILLLGLLAIGVIAQAWRLQLSQANQWRDKAQDNITATRALPASRGRILDVKGRVLARDEPCVDVAVEFRALVEPVDQKWLDDRATRMARLKPEWRGLERKGRRELTAQMRMQTLGDLEEMWGLLAAVSGQSREEINEKRQEISDKVTRRREIVWRRQFERKYDQWKNRTPDPLLVRLLIGEPPEPKLNELSVEIEEELQRHVILADIDTESMNILKLQSDRLPGLALLPGVKRTYPYNDVGAHVIGQLARVTKQDIDEDAERDQPDRRLLLNDRIGRSGIERLAEQWLRGTRGEIVVSDSSSELQSSESSKPGKDLRTTIDVDLQSRVQRAFEKVEYQNPGTTANPGVIDVLRMPGAAVVIHVPTGEVRAMVSYPSYDLNRFEELYPKLLADELEQPMMNRATNFIQEPGSTVKPLVALGAITQGLITAQGTIECDGYLKFDGKPVRFGRCWTMSVFNIAHHKVPFNAAHPTGFLTAEEALERSCNVYFETLGDKLKLDGLTYWYSLFGLGRSTGVGLPESGGALPNSFKGDAGSRRSAAALSAIGQGHVLVTPIQLANMTATIARGSVWVRPRLIADAGFKVPLRAGDDRPDRMPLNIDPSAIDNVQRGMRAVVNSPAGTGTKLHRSEISVSGKTGTATASKLTVFQRDTHGVVLKDDAGDPIAEQIPYGTRERPNPKIPWYRLSNPEAGTANHAWVVGYLPSDKPEYAFAVFVQYGNKGGMSAGSVGVEIISALEDLGYVVPGANSPKPAVKQAAPTTVPVELLGE